MKFFIFIFSSLLGLHLTFAQNLLPEPVTITTDPESPKPGETFTAKVNSLATDLNKADISWSINKKLVSKDFGQKEIKTTLPYGNQIVLLEVSVKTVSGETFYTKKTLSPKRIVLIVEAADSYVPYWYTGKAEVSRGGYAKVYAYTEIYSGQKKLRPSELVYIWSVRDEPVLSQSGPGRDTLLYKMLDEYGDNIPVSVSISPIQSDDGVTDQTNITTKDPEVLMFLGDENGLAVSSRVISNNQKLFSKTFSIIAEPFFFSTDYTRNKNLEYSWGVNNQAQEDNSNSVRFFKLPDATSGKVNINILVKHTSRIFQDAKRSITLSF